MARVSTVDNRRVVREEPDVAPVDQGRNVASQIIWFVAGVILLLLAFRFILALLGANPNNAFANFIYDTSHPFVSPFFGLFNYNNYRLGVGHFEVYTLIAVMVYAAIAWGLSALVDIGRRY